MQVHFHDTFIETFELFDQQNICNSHSCARHKEISCILSKFNLLFVKKYFYKLKVIKIIYIYFYVYKHLKFGARKTRNQYLSTHTCNKVSIDIQLVFKKKHQIQCLFALKLSANKILLAPCKHSSK